MISNEMNKHATKFNKEWHRQIQGIWLLSLLLQQGGALGANEVRTAIPLWLDDDLAMQQTHQEEF